MSTPTLTDTRKFLEEQRLAWKRGWTNLVGPEKGKVTDANALRAIACLTVAIKNIPCRKKGGAQ